MKRSPLRRGKPLKRGTKRLPQRSAKTVEKYKERVPLVRELLAERPWCEACPLFAEHDGLVAYQRRRSVDVHEVKSRGRGGSILERENCRAVCPACHDRIGDDDALAVELGLSAHSWD